MFQVQHAIYVTGMSTNFVQHMFDLRVTELYVREVRVHVFEVNYQMIFG